MKNKIIISSTSALAGVVVGYMLKSTLDNFNGHANDHEEDYFKDVLENAGKPDEIDSIERDQLENAKMVSEGSQFGVQYYNELMDDNISD